MKILFCILSIIAIIILFITLCRCVTIETDYSYSISRVDPDTKMATSLEYEFITVYDNKWNLLYFDIQTDKQIHDVEYITGYIQLGRKDIEFEIVTENLLSDERLSDFGLEGIEKNRLRFEARIHEDLNNILDEIYKNSKKVKYKIGKEKYFDFRENADIYLKFLLNYNDEFIIDNRDVFIRKVPHRKYLYEVILIPFYWVYFKIFGFKIF